MRVFASVPLLLGALGFSSLGALARPSTVVHSEPLCLEQDTPQHGKRKFRKCMSSIGSDTSVAGSSFSSSPHEPLAEKPLDLVSVNSADIVTARLEFTAVDYEAKSIACGSSFPACCIYNPPFYTCIDPMLSLYAVYYILTFPNTVLAGRDLSKDGLRRLCAATGIGGHQTHLCCCDDSLLGVSHYQYQLLSDITNDIQHNCSPA